MIIASIIRRNTLRNRCTILFRRVIDAKNIFPRNRESEKAAGASACRRPAITSAFATRDALFRISFSEESPREPSTPSLAVLDTAVRRRHAKKTRISRVHRAHRRALVCRADVQGVSEVRLRSPSILSQHVSAFPRAVLAEKCRINAIVNDVRNTGRRL